jgi:hypothetical protein
LRKSIIVVVVVVLVAVILGWYLSVNYFTFPSQNEDNNPQTDVFSIEEVRDRTMTYIAANYTQTLPVMSALHWSGGREETGLLAAETYHFHSGDWAMSIEYPVVPSHVYKIKLNNTAEGEFMWTGTCIDGEIDQVTSTAEINTNITVEQARDLTLMYLNAYHNQTSMYMHDLSWRGGRMAMGMIGSEKYNYVSTGWNVTLQYPVVPNPMFTINADYTLASKSPIMMWEGTMQNGTITQISYKYNR